MSDIAPSHTEDGFDPEKGFYEAGTFVMAEQERFIGEQAQYVINAAEQVTYDAGRKYEAAHKVSLLELGAMVLAGAFIGSVIEAATRKDK